MILGYTLTTFPKSLMHNQSNRNLWHNCKEIVNYTTNKPTNSTDLRAVAPCRSDTHNISAYEAEMSHHMTLHEDVLERILNILKQDDYYRAIEDLPVIDNLTVYDDIRLFPELYDTSNIIERITGKADLIERQLRQQGMYPLPTNLSTSTSTSAPRPTSTFEPISPQQLTDNQNTESSPQSSLPCGQRTPASSTNTSDSPSQHTSPQPFVHSQPQPHNPTPMRHTSPKPHKQQDIQHSPVKTNVNPPTQPPISDEEQQCVPKSTNGSQVKHSKPQLRQQDECLCFYCNQSGHLQRNCPEIPYCSKCRTRGHTPDRCTRKPQQNGHTHQTGESRDQQRRNQDLPLFLSHHNRCLHCAGDHQTKDCTTTWQWQTPTTNSPASVTGTSTHKNTPNTSHSSSHSNSQSPSSHQHSQSTIHVQTPTLNINAPQFQPNLHQAPPPPLAQNNQSTNYHTNQQQMHTPPTQPFNTQLPQSFNPHVPPPYFPQYPPTNSPSANSTDSLILLALQKQWERQERLDMECNEMERQKKERKRMKEEREQRKEDRKQVEKCENQQRSRINKAFEKIPRFDGTNPSYCFHWLKQTEALVNEHQGRIYREELLLNCGTSMSKTIHALPQGATNQHIKDAVLGNHSNLRTVSQ